MAKEILLEAKNIKKYFPIRKGIFQKVAGHVKAVDDISLIVCRGETLGLVGESGCGKSTLGRTLLMLHQPTSGEIWFDNQSLTKMDQESLRKKRREFQMIFQDPNASLNPRHTIQTIIEEPMAIHHLYSSRREREDRAKQLLENVGLSSYHLSRKPKEFSGGQKQRIGIARALALHPQLIVADEPVSALDVSVQSQVINLMQDLQKEFQLTYIFISHDLSVVKHISDRIGVMYLGQLAEIAPKKKLYDNPIHPYTKALISAIPVAEPMKKRERILLTGDLPSPSNPPKGCRFHTRCPAAKEICRHQVPVLEEIQPDHWVSCHLAKEI